MVVNRKNLLITGGTGYIGSRLVRHSLNEGCWNITVSTRKSPNHLCDFPVDRVEIVDLTKMANDEVGALFRRLDAIVHLAALNERDSIKDVARAIDVNIGKTVRLNQIAEAAGVSTFIYFSTAHVYGSPLAGQLGEESACFPSHPYSITHKAAEDFLLAERNNRGINNIVVRLSNAFGYPAYATSDRWTLLVNDICRQAVKDQRIVLKSNGAQFRNFVCLEDVCKAVEYLLGFEKERLGNGILNLGSEHTLSILEMARRVKDRYDLLTEGDIPIEINKMDHSYSAKLYFSIDKLRSLGIGMENNFSEEIDGMLEFCSKAKLV